MLDLKFLLITAENRAEHSGVLDEMHRLRHQVFVETLKWPNLTSCEGREYDAYDTPKARYIVVLEKDKVVASVRLNSFADPTLLTDIFPHLVQFSAIPTDAKAVDLTRFVVSPKVGDESRMERYGAEIIAAILEYGAAERLREFTAVISTHFLTTVLSWGIEATAIGFPVGEGRESHVAVRVPVSEAQVSKIYQHTRGFRPRLMEPSFVRWHRETFGPLSKVMEGPVLQAAD
ncbi:acyl-homoserine-lactone synthase [Parvibaculum sp.]|uniref:acyl-homoserine-lactone synthase n=1 Tax=Parvibaculum sp. TaxID=2024848 RepID=UPI0039194B82